jgi:hypothetical protein
MQSAGFQNLTPFVAESLILLDEEGREVLTLIAKATYEIPSQGTALALAPAQEPLVLASTHHGEPGRSSLRYASDAVTEKLATDVVLLGHAWADRGLAPEVDVTLEVGPIQKQVRVFGDRTWRRLLGAMKPSSPRPFRRMPLVYERAFGGVDTSSSSPEEHIEEPENPVGVGFVRPVPGRDYEGLRLPNIEDPAALLQEPIDRRRPMGFGFVAPSWAPRRIQAGTFDEAWRAARFPRLPANFNRRHHNAAPLDQQARPLLEGGEPAKVIGASERGTLRFTLPVCRLRGRYQLRRSEAVAVAMRLDTVVIDTDAHRVAIVYRGGAPVHRRAHDLLHASVELLADAAARRP